MRSNVLAMVWYSLLTITNMFLQTLNRNKYQYQTLSLRSKELKSSSGMLCCTTETEKTKRIKEQKFNRAFKYYKDAIDLLDKKKRGELDYLKLGGINYFFEKYQNEALRWLPSDFLNEIEGFKFSSHGRE